MGGNIVYGSKEMLYSNEKFNKRYREWVVSNLFKVSIKLFKDSYNIRNFEKLETKLKKLTIRTNLWNFVKEDFIDQIKIVTCFENYMKGILILKGYLVHDINRKMDNEKFNVLGNIRKKPIKISNIKKIECCDLDGEEIKNYYLSGIEKKTIPMSTLLNKKYQRVIKLPKKVYNIIFTLNEQRNHLHFQVKNGVNYNEQVVKDLRVLIEFVNGKIIKKHNQLTNKLEFPEIHLIDEVKI